MRPREQEPARGDREQVGQPLGALARQHAQLRPPVDLDQPLPVGLRPVDAVDERGVLQPRRLPPAPHDLVGADEMVEEAPAGGVRAGLSAFSLQEGEKATSRWVVRARMLRLRLRGSRHAGMLTPLGGA